MQEFRRSWIGRGIAGLLSAAVAGTGTLPLILVLGQPPVGVEAAGPITLSQPAQVAWTLDPSHLSQLPSPLGPWLVTPKEAGPLGLRGRDFNSSAATAAQPTGRAADSPAAGLADRTAGAGLSRGRDSGYHTPDTGRAPSAQPAPSDPPARQWSPAWAEAASPARGWLSASDRELLARTVYAEARGEPFAGQVAVAAVILNRRDDPRGRWPQRIAEIIYQPGAFSAVDDGQIDLAPDATAYRAVDAALDGWDPTGGAVYYWNPAKTTSQWIWSRPVITVIGEHWFAR